MTSTRAAQPSNEPSDVLVQQLDDALRSEVADVYAGLTFSSNGAIQLHLTKNSPEVETLIDRVVAALRNTVSDAQRLPSIERIVGARNSLRLLERTRDRVQIRRLGLDSCGIRISVYGVDVWANRVRIEAHDLTQEAKAFLEVEFGAETVNVVEGGQRSASAPSR